MYSTLQASNCIKFAFVSLAKANYKVKPIVHMGGLPIRACIQWGVKFGIIQPMYHAQFRYFFIEFMLPNSDFQVFHFFGSSCPGPAWSREGCGENLLELSQIVFCPHSELLHLQLLNHQRKEKSRNYNAWYWATSMKPMHLTAEVQSASLLVGKN